MISRKKDKLLGVSSRVHESGTPSGEYLLIYTARLPIHFGLEALTGPGVSMPSLQFLKKGRFFIDRLDPADKEQGSNLEDTFILVRQEGVLTRAPSEFLVELTTTRGALHSASFASSIRFARHVIMCSLLVHACSARGRFRRNDTLARRFDPLFKETVDVEIARSTRKIEERKKERLQSKCFFNREG